LKQLKQSSAQKKEIDRCQKELDDLIEKAKQAREKSSSIFKARYSWKTAKENLSDKRKGNRPSPKEKFTRLFEIDKKFKELYDIKEDFRDIYESENRKAAKDALDDFVDKYGDKHRFLKKTVRNNEVEILNRFTDEGKDLIENLRKFERRRGAFRKFESWEILIDLLLEHSCDGN